MFARIVPPVCLALCLSCAAAGEKLLKPVPGPGAGQAVDGLRTAVSMVKNDFGPGESLLVVWELFNDSGRTVELRLDKKHWYDLSFEIRRDGNRVEPLRASAKQRPDFRAAALVLEAGQSSKHFIDLTALDWTDPKWSAPFGNYEVSVSYTPLRLQSGWARFRVMQAGEPRPAPPPELAERIRTLIAQLSAEEFAARDQAYQQLLAIGKPALPLLEEIVATGGDTEAVRRCQRLINEINARLNPQPPPRPPPPPPQPVPPIPQPPPRPQPPDPDPPWEF